MRVTHCDTFGELMVFTTAEKDGKRDLRRAIGTNQGAYCTIAHNGSVGASTAPGHKAQDDASARWVHFLNFGV